MVDPLAVPPGALWAQNDTLGLHGFHHDFTFSYTGTPVLDATKVVRYELVRSGLARPPSPLYNPKNIGSETGKDANPYLEQERPDPHHP